MKFSLALLASVSYAVKVEDIYDDLEDAISVTLFEDGTWTADTGDYYYDDYYYDDYYWDDDYWVDDWEYVCSSDWIWEECSSMYYRSACDEETPTDCGWFYSID